MIDFAITLDERPNVPLYQQLCEALRNAILSGRLPPGHAMPSTRELSNILGISRFTVIKSFEILLSQGYLETEKGTGTFVSKNLPATAEAIQQSKPDCSSGPRRESFSRFGRRLLEREMFEPLTAGLIPELNYGAPSAEHLPFKQWRQLLLRHLRFEEGPLFQYRGDPLGHLPLREAIAGYLVRSRAVKCDASQVVIFTGAQPAVDLIARLFIQPGDNVAVENPGFDGARRRFSLQEANIVPIPVDDQGIIVDELKRYPEPIKLVYVTPSHHDPSGVPLSLTRRKELLQWAKDNHVLIVEDDYDSEYRYATRPIPALQGLDDHGCVIYVSTFWKVLFPVLRLGFMVLPSSMIPVVSCYKLMIERDLPLLDQCALTDFINEGHLERHIRRTRGLYARRRQVLVQHLTRQFGKKAVLSKESAGMHLLVKFQLGLSDTQILECAAQAQMAMISTESHYDGPSIPGEFLIPFAHVNEQEIEESVIRFAQEVQQLQPEASPIGS